MTDKTSYQSRDDVVCACWGAKLLSFDSFMRGNTIFRLLFLSFDLLIKMEILFRIIVKGVVG